jgi:phage tail-like protein
VVDANGTRFHLLLGEADWMRARTAHGEPAFPPQTSPPSRIVRDLEWNAARQEVTLWQDTFRFRGSGGDRVSVDNDRRGAARDRFGNWYWIAPDRHAIYVWSSGSQAISTFWPAADGCPAAEEDEGGFRAVSRPATAPPLLQGLAVTDDHYLVAGTTGAASEAGLLMFDLFAGGPPRRRLWPVAFAPFDLDARQGGGVWVLDRANRRVWELDRRFEIVTGDRTVPGLEDGRFLSADGRDEQVAVHRAPIRLEHGWPIAAADPISVAAFPGGGVLVLERDGGDDFARVHWLPGAGAPATVASTSAMVAHIAPDPDALFTLVGHDFTFGKPLAGDPKAWAGRLYVVAPDGNQAYAFGVDTSHGRLSLNARPEYFPMRLFKGRALVSSGGDPWYDCGDSWVRLVRQDRPRYAESGELWTPVFDSGEPGCVWHRLMLDACIPPGASVDVQTRASDDWRELALVEWLSAAEQRALGASPIAAPGDAVSENDLAEWQPEPTPRLRSHGSELPYLDTDTGGGRGTWELLFQRAQGRYLQIRLVLRGDGRSTPRLRALRAWYPRFSYLDRYLPAVYRENAQSASFLDRFLANFEGLFTTIEDRIAAAQMLFDVASAPAETLDWLGRWLGVALDPSWREDRRRLFLRHAMDFFAARGTLRGLQLALRLALDDCVDDRLFTESTTAGRGAAPVRIVERFRARRTPPALLGEVRIAVPGPQPFNAAVRWQPAAGAADLHWRYRDALGLPAGAEFPLVPTGAPDGWRAFAQDVLGFVPRAGAAERARWQKFLQRRHQTIGALNDAHATTWSSFDEVGLPADEPPAGAVATDWLDVLDQNRTRERRSWQEFLTRRYRSVAALNLAWRTRWRGLESVALADRLSLDAAPLADWFQFEGTALAMQRTAHRFTVMLPVPRHLRTDTPAQQRRVALARTVLDLEKPAHTAYDMRFYWEMFRLGEARLGDDTLVDLGSRSPELMGPMVLGEGYLAEAFLAVPPGADAPDRLAIGRDRVGRSTRVGGP